MNTYQDPNKDPPISWTTLLVHWTAMAKAVSLLPATATGEGWRKSVAPALGLHAIAMALGDILTLPPAERPLAIDRATIGIEGFERDLVAAWEQEAMPLRLVELIADARVALSDAVSWVRGPLSSPGESPASADPGA